jgi:hypothetical protein
MRARFRLSDLIPAELNVEAVHHGPDDAIFVAAYGQSPHCRCPECGTASRRIHSRYPRVISDLPCSGRPIELHLFDASSVLPRIAAERFSPSASVMAWSAPWLAGQHVWTVWFAITLSHWVVRLAARFVDRLGFPVSNDTLL